MMVLDIDGSLSWLVMNDKVNENFWPVQNVGSLDQNSNTLQNSGPAQIKESETLVGLQPEKE